MKRVLLALLAVSCAGEVPDEAPVVDIDEAAAPIGTYMVVPKGVVASEVESNLVADAPPQRTIFMNRNGGTYTPGSDNSSTNRSSIPSFTATVPAYEGTDAQWNQLLTCVQDQFARFNVVVTDVDPGSIPHVEAVMGGNPGNIGMSAGVGGVAPMYGDCSMVERAVVYVFTKVFSSVQVECEVAAQEIGHAIGMDHEYLCADPMTYLSGCGAKSFQDVAAQCGEYSPRACMCGGSTQNSVQFMFGRLGPSGGTPPPPPPPPPGTDTTPPTVTLVSPANGSTQPANASLSVVATASDETAMGDAVLRWQVGATTHSMSCASPPSGVTCNSSGGTYTWTLSVGTGARSFSVRATDAAGNTAQTPTWSITLGASTPPPPPPGGAPSVTIDTPTVGETVLKGSPLPVRITASDSDGSVVDARLRWIAPSGEVVYRLYKLDATTWGIDLNVSPYAVDGPRTLRVSVWDNAGNRTTAPDLTITVD